MEDSNIGAHCADKACNKRDFLPYYCPFCKLKFCQDHKHSSFECPETASSDKHPIVEHPEIVKCSEAECLEKSSYLIVECVECWKKFCLKHRLPGDHNCEKLKQVEEEQKKKIEDKPKYIPVQNTEKKEQTSKKLLTGKNLEMQKKIDRIKIKNSAVGDPSISREYRYAVRVYNDEDTKGFPVSVYFKQSTLIGQALDYLSSKYKFNLVKNPLDPENTRLNMFTSSGAKLEYSKSFSEIVGLESGDDLILKRSKEF